uniref:Protein kinase domain-containing protein n=1 Tax=Haplochromis burtoni TaxID=8153 RepID=A0A3Q3C4X3_HAPBU
MLKGKKVGFSDFLHKFVSSQHLCQQQPESYFLSCIHIQLLCMTYLYSDVMKPSDFDYLKVIGRGSFGKLVAVFLLSFFYYLQTNRKHLHALTNNLDCLLKETNKETTANVRFCRTQCSLFLCRDLKPENILLDSEGHVMLTDFGLCKEGVATGGVMHTFCGTPEYLAPEVLHGHPYSPAVDWWGLGTVAYEMICGLPPFYSRSKLQMFQNILHGPLQLRSDISKAACSLLEGLLEKDVSRRLGASCDIAELQEHPFFASIDWDDLLARKIRPPFIPKVAGPWDVSYIDPAFTRQPVPACVNDRCQEAGVSEAFQGFSYMNPVEYLAAEPVS